MSQRMSQVGVMVLIKKAADTADKQKGFKIYPLNESTGRADYNAASQIVWKADVDRRFRPSVVGDVCCLPFRSGLKPDVLLLSPPCDNFSLMSNKWPKAGIGRALAVVGGCLEAVVWLQPKRWLLENPKGRLRWFLGKVSNSVCWSDYDLNYKAQKPSDFWGNVGFPMVKGVRRPKTKLRGKHTKNFYECFGSVRSANAKVPIGVSFAVLEAVS